MSDLQNILAGSAHAGLRDERTSGTLIKMIQEGLWDDLIEEEDSKDLFENTWSNQGLDLNGDAEITPQQKREPTLEEVMSDPEFLVEARLGNEVLQNWMNRSRILHAVEFLVIEPSTFAADAARCFKLPYVACEFFISEQATWLTEGHLFPHESDGNGATDIVEFEVLQRIFSFFERADPNVKGVTPLNQTLGGYLNKIASFWLLRRP